MNGEQFDTWIGYLEHFRRRPGCYIVECVPELAQAFFEGFRLALQPLLGSNEYFILRAAVIAERGWIPRATGIIYEMIQRGLTPEQIVDELIVIEIEVLRRVGVPMP